MNAREQLQNILETYGAHNAYQATKTLTTLDVQENLKPIFNYISKTWRDPLTPAMMNLSCKVVGGEPEETQKYAIAVSLLNLSMRTWDDVIDKTTVRSLKKTTVGEIGEKNSIIIGGLISAKAFLTLNQTRINLKKEEAIAKILWTYLSTMSEAEIIDNGIKPEFYLPKNKLQKIKTEAIGLETCLSIGGIVGNGSEEEINALGNYGRILGTLLELWKDLLVSLNLTMELEQKIRNKKLPYFILRTKKYSLETRELLKKMSKNDIEGQDIGILVENVLKNNTKIIKTKVESLTTRGINLLEPFRGCEEKENLKKILSIQPKIFDECLNG